jgi:DNA-binding IclR family transcriptional regulator
MANRPPARRRGIQSVEIGLRVLSALAASRNWDTLTSVAARAGLSPSQTHRYLQSLIAAGMAVQNPNSARYGLGPATIRIGIAALARNDVFSVASEAVTTFTEKTGRTAFLSVWGEAGATIVRWFPGNPPVITALALGSVLPLLYSATGHVYCSFLMPQEIAGRLEQELENHPGGSINLQQIRRTTRIGLHAEVSGAFIPGLRAIAMPIFDIQGRLAAVATAISSTVFPTSGDRKALAALEAACRYATEKSGGNWPTARRR